MRATTFGASHTARLAPVHDGGMEMGEWTQRR